MLSARRLLDPAPIWYFKARRRAAPLRAAQCRCGSGAPCAGWSVRRFLRGSTGSPRHGVRGGVGDVGPGAQRAGAPGWVQCNGEKAEPPSAPARSSASLSWAGVKTRAHAPGPLLTIAALRSASARFPPSPRQLLRSFSRGLLLGVCVYIGIRVVQYGLLQAAETSQLM